MSNKPKFDPTQPFEEVTEKPKFDPTQAFEAVDEEPAHPANEAPTETPDEVVEDSGISAPESAFRGGIEMASGGFIDELAGGLEAAGSVVGLRGLGEDKLQMPRGETPEEKKQSLLEVYRAMRDKRRGINKEAEEANPKSYTAGQVVGGGITAFSPVKAAKVPGWLANLGLGGTVAAGHSEAETLPELAEDTAKGAAMNFGFGAGFGALGKGANKVSQGFKKTAEKNAVDSLAPMLSNEKAMATKGLRDKLGRELLDEGVTKFGASPAKQADALGPLLSKKGKLIGNIRDSVDDQASRLAKSGDSIAADARRVDFDTALAKRAERAKKAAVGGSMEEKNMVKALGKNVDSMSEVPARSLKDSSKAMSKLDNQIPWHKPEAEWTPSQRALAQVRRNLSKQMDGKVRGFTGKFDEYQDAKQTFGLFKEGEKIANQATLRGKGDLVPGLKDLMLSNAATKDGLSAIPSAIATKIVRDRGHAAVAKTADVAYKLLNTTPEVMGKYNGPLMQAMKKGNKAFLATHLILMNQDPEYKQLVESASTGDEG